MAGCLSIPLGTDWTSHLSLVTTVFSNLHNGCQCIALSLVAFRSSRSVWITQTGCVPMMQDLALQLCAKAASYEIRRQILRKSNTVHYSMLLNHTIPPPFLRSTPPSRHAQYASQLSNSGSLNALILSDCWRSGNMGRMRDGENGIQPSERGCS